jgi:hypothetical protein
MALLSDTGRVLLFPEWLLSQVDGDGALAYLAISYLARDEDYLDVSEADRDDERVETTAWVDAAAGRAIVERVAEHWQWPENRARAALNKSCVCGPSNTWHLAMTSSPDQAYPYYGSTCGCHEDPPRERRFVEFHINLWKRVRGGSGDPLRVNGTL